MSIITVKDVIEQHDSSGRVFIDITSMGSDELIPSRYRLTERYMVPHEKLMLSTVAPEDEVVINDNVPLGFHGRMDIIDQAFGVTLMRGEYIQNRFDATWRSPICSCGAPLNSDGFYIYCPDPTCYLSTLPRIQRLASTPFFELGNWPPAKQPLFDVFTISAHRNLGMPPPTDTPFAILGDRGFWNDQAGADPETILARHQKRTGLTLSTFLIADNLRSFIDMVYTQALDNRPAAEGLTYFFEVMDLVVFHRDYSSNIQNYMIKQFLWSLGLTYLTQELIEKMMVAEEVFGQMADVFLPYVEYLTNPTALQVDMGLSFDHADALVREFRWRGDEMREIFTHYGDPASMEELFVNKGWK